MDVMAKVRCSREDFVNQDMAKVTRDVNSQLASTIMLRDPKVRSQTAASFAEMIVDHLF